LGRATSPRRRASARMAGVKASAKTNATAGGIRLERFAGNIVGDYKRR